jgi:hypothetical protein
MASTYSSNLKIELMGTGENSGTWGNITNTNLGTALEQAVIGLGNPDYTSDANLTITITDTNAAQAARALVLNVTSAFGSLTATRELIVPTIQKQYIVQNNTTGGQSITVKTSAGTGITVPNGRKAHLYVNGTDVIQMFDFVNILGGTIDNTTLGATTASSARVTTLNASGATTLDGTVALGNAAGDLITVPGTVNSNLIFTDNTYDIGASGATRPRNLFLAGAATVGGNLSVGGTLTLTGGVNLNGNVTVGDASTDTLTINSTITSNLIFTDNTYDIGASGATRPRNLFLAGNATIGGAQTLTGALTVDSTTDSSSTTTGSIQTDGGVGIAKALFVGTTANIAGALTVNTTALVSSGTNNIGINTASPLTNGATYGTLTINGSNGGAIQFATAGASIAQIYNDGNALFINPATGKTLSLQIASSTVASVSSTGVAVTGTLSASGPANNIATFNSTHANGLYLSWKTSGTDRAYMGSASSISTVGTIDDTDIYAIGKLRFFGDNQVASYATVSSTGLAVTGTLSATINTGGYGYVSTLRNSGGISALQIIGTAAGPTTGGGSIAATGGGVLTLFAGSTVGSVGTSVADISTSGISVTGTLSATGGTSVATSSGYLTVGTVSATGMNASDIGIPNNKYLRGTVAAGTSSVALIGLDPSNTVQINANNASGGTTVTGNLTSTTLQLGTNPAGVSIGVLGIPNQKRIYGRNAANSADVNIAYVNGSDGLVLGPSDAATIDSSSNLSVQGFQLKLGTSSGSQVIISRAARPSVGSAGLQLYAGASATVNDAAPAAYITLGSGPLGDTYEGGVSYYAYGNTTGSGFQNAHTWYRRTSVDTVSQTMQISPTGVLDIGTGAGAVGQIKFPSTQVASSDANTLDDYEEGTWTPTDASGAGLTFTVDYATYTKVGRAVSIQGAITYPTTANTATALFHGFPFNAANAISMSVIYSDASVASFTYLSGNATAVYPLTPGLNVTNATLSGKLIFFAGTYFV